MDSTVEDRNLDRTIVLLCIYNIAKVDTEPFVVVSIMVEPIHKLVNMTAEHEIELVGTFPEKELTLAADLVELLTNFFQPHVHNFGFLFWLDPVVEVINGMLLCWLWIILAQKMLGEIIEIGTLDIILNPLDTKN